MKIVNRNEFEKMVKNYVDNGIETTEGMEDILSTYVCLAGDLILVSQGYDDNSCVNIDFYYTEYAKELTAMYSIPKCICLYCAGSDDEEYGTVYGFGETYGMALKEAVKKGYDRLNDEPGMYTSIIYGISADDARELNLTSIDDEHIEFVEHYESGTEKYVYVR